MDGKHLLSYVITPVLEHLTGAALRGGRTAVLDTLAAHQLLLGTAIQESRLLYLRQLGSGPALGLWQMEPATHDDIWANYLRYHPDLAAKVEALSCRLWPIGATQMQGNLYYACAMARCLYFRVPDLLPAAGNVKGLVGYWKSHYNTPLGAGTVEKALPAFAQAVEMTQKE